MNFKRIPLRVSHAPCVLAIMASLVSGCSVYSKHGVQSVSISPDDRSFAVAYHKGRESLIAVGDMDSGTSTVVLKSTDGTKYERPIFSRDGNKLYFISREKKDKGNLFTVAVDGSDLQQLTSGQQGAQDIRDIALSNEDDRIYYINAGFFGSYSPIAASRPHQLDYYSVNKDGSGIERLSFGAYYALSGLSLSPDGKSIYERFAILSLDEPGQFRPFAFDSPSRLTMTSEYPLSEFTGDRVVLACSKIEERRPGYSSRTELKLGEFSAVYGSGLFLIDSVDEAVVNEVVYLASHLDSPALSRDGKRVLFIRNDSVWGGNGDKTLWSVNVDGSHLQQIPLALSDRQ